jgi:hypothetical protein
LSGCRNLDVAAQRYDVMTTWSNPRAGFPTSYVTVPLILCVQWVKIGNDCSFLVPYQWKPKGTIVSGSVRTSVRPSVRPSVCPSVRHIKILSCPDFFFTSFDILTWYLVCGYIYMSYNLSSNFVPVEWFLAELWPFNLYFLFKFKLSGFFWHPLRYWLNMWYVAISKWVTVYIWISFWSNDLWLSYSPWTCIFCSNFKFSGLLWRPLRYWLNIWYVAISRWVTV